VGFTAESQDLHRGIGMGKPELLSVLTRLGWTMARLSSETGIPVEQISRWEEVPLVIEKYVGLLLRVRILEGRTVPETSVFNNFDWLGDDYERVLP